MNQTKQPIPDICPVIPEPTTAYMGLIMAGLAIAYWWRKWSR